MQNDGFGDCRSEVRYPSRLAKRPQHRAKISAIYRAQIRPNCQSAAERPSQRQVAMKSLKWRMSITTANSPLWGVEVISKPKAYCRSANRFVRPRGDGHRSVNSMKL